MADAKSNLFLDTVGGKSRGLNMVDRDYFRNAQAGKSNRETGQIEIYR